MVMTPPPAERVTLESDKSDNTTRKVSVGSGVLSTEMACYTGEAEGASSWIPTC